jgi:hypothetical protein
MARWLNILVLIVLISCVDSASKAVIDYGDSDRMLAELSELGASCQAQLAECTFGFVDERGEEQTLSVLSVNGMPLNGYLFVLRPLSAASNDLVQDTYTKISKLMRLGDDTLASGFDSIGKIANFCVTHGTIRRDRYYSCRVLAKLSERDLSPIAATGDDLGTTYVVTGITEGAPSEPYRNRKTIVLLVGMPDKQNMEVDEFLPFLAE